jgi:hypothetical protein
MSSADTVGSDAASKSDTQHFQNARKELGENASLSDVATRAQEMKDEAAAGAKAEETAPKTPPKSILTATPESLGPVSSLDEAAESLKTAAKPVFDRLDTLTKGGETTFSDYQRLERMARRSGDFDAADAAREAQEKILDKFSDQFHPDDLKKGRALWRQAVGMDELSDKIFGNKGIMHDTPPELLSGQSMDLGYLNGKNLSKQLIQLNRDGVLEKAGLTPTHRQALQNIATTLSKGNNVSKMNGLVKGLAALGVAIGTHGLGVGTLATEAQTAGGALFASKVLGKIMTDPRAAQAVDKVLESGIGTPAAMSILKPIFQDETEQKPKESL